jgi:hypothetical protein
MRASVGRPPAPRPPGARGEVAGVGVDLRGSLSRPPGISLPATRQPPPSRKPTAPQLPPRLPRRADRELAALDHLAPAPQLTRTRIAAGLRELEQTPTVPAAKQVSTPTGKRRGPPENVQETARRAAVLERVQAGEISNAEAATEIGIPYGTWAHWKALYAKRAGVIPAPIARASVEPTSIPTGKPAADVAKLVARVEELERFGREMRERVLALVRLVERWLGRGALRWL